MKICHTRMSPILPEMSRLGAESVDWDHVLRATEASTLSNWSCRTVAGPSTHYTLRQKVVHEHLPQLKVECSVCGEAVHPHATVRLVCSDVYCSRASSSISRMSKVGSPVLDAVKWCFGMRAVTT